MEQTDSGVSIQAEGNRAYVVLLCVCPVIQ